ncbi:hypothetical protein AKJ43_01470 [candidate division MSBL1 archaeon SCGC-AAA261D19]|uniref:Uncharacterized protein n=1 Tax=candidate division MSBL1 archaeon SCGC-AAA261D19 TaxID=1698273 RepID=A0A133V829_9EURY|nr:hypothetical protein AKJ43_01470 [candidate division MSBL1 archaeon SCGC-AAA261D19]
MVFEKIKKFFEVESEEMPEVREISFAELEEEISRRREKKIKEAEKDSKSYLEDVPKIRNAINKLSSDLAEAELNEDIYATIYKSVNESKRLLIKKMRRTSEYIESTPPPHWNKLMKFNESLNNAANLLGNAIASHGGRVATVFNEKVARLEELANRLQSVSQNLNDILQRRENQIEELDGISSIVSELEDLKREEKKLREKKESLKKNREKIEKNITKNQESLESLRKSQPFKELKKLEREKKQINERKKKIRSTIQSTVSKISRPMRKMKKLIQNKKHAVERDTVEGLKLYSKDPFKAVMSEKEGLPKFEALLRGLKELMENEMKLSRKERQKRSKHVQNLLEDKTLTKLRTQYEEEKKRKSKLEKKIKSSSLLERMDKLKESIQKSKKNLKTAQNDLKTTKEKYAKTRDQIEEKTNKLKNALESQLRLRVTDI